jgi:hypothetical protein
VRAGRVVVWAESSEGLEPWLRTVAAAPIPDMRAALERGSRERRACAFLMRSGRHDGLTRKDLSADAKARVGSLAAYWSSGAWVIPAYWPAARRPTLTGDNRVRADRRRHGDTVTRVTRIYSHRPFIRKYFYALECKSVSPVSPRLTESPISGLSSGQIEDLRAPVHARPLQEAVVLLTTLVATPVSRIFLIGLFTGPVSRNTPINFIRRPGKPQKPKPPRDASSETHGRMTVLPGQPRSAHCAVGCGRSRSTALRGCCQSSGGLLLNITAAF